MVPLIVPVAFATRWFVPIVLPEPPREPVEATEPPADPVPSATHAAGNARLPLYDDGCAQTKGGCSR